MDKPSSDTKKSKAGAQHPCLSVVAGKAVASHCNNLTITTMHQIAELIVHLATPISAFTSAPERYCKIWHETIGSDIIGIRDMLDRLDRAYGNVNADRLAP